MLCTDGCLSQKTNKKHIINFIQLNNFKWPVFVFFALYMVIGLLVYQDYGITWDEPIQRDHGMVSWDAVNERFDYVFYEKRYQKEKLAEYKHRHYGVLFQLTALQLERTFGIESIRGQFFLRHLLGFLFYFVSVFFFYKIIYQRTNSWKWGLVGALFLILSPRLFAHSFFNPKDTITFSAYLIATFTLLQFIEKKDIKRAVLHALATGILLNTRITGLVIPVLTFGVLFWEYVVIGLIKNYFPTSKSKNNNLSTIKPIKTGISCIVYLISFFFFTYLFWPFLWDNPIENFFYAWETFSKYAAWDGQILYWGKYVRSSNLPWHYVPSYMIATIPLVFSPLFFSGLFFILRSVLKSKGWVYQSKEARTDLILLATFIAPLLAVIVLNATMYDGWRHTYFIYGGFLGVTTIGLFKIWQLRFTKKWIWRIALALVIVNMADTTYWMVRYHPLQNTYFNLYAGKNVIRRMEIDYWGQGFKLLYETLAELDKSEKIRVEASSYPGWENYRALEPELQDRFIYNWDKKPGGYYLTNYRFEEELNRWKKNTSFFKDPVHIIYVRRTPVLGIYCLEDFYD